MLDLQAAGRNPCTTCRIIAIIIALFTLSIFNDHGVESSDFFGLRHYLDVHVPATIDIFLTFVNVAIIWALCELVVVDRLIRRKPAGSGGSHQDHGARPD